VTARESVTFGTAKRFLEGPCNGQGRPTLLNSIELRSHSIKIAVDRGQPIQPMAMLLRLLAHGNVGQVNWFCEIGNF
jgi:hypothetical protein